MREMKFETCNMWNSVKSELRNWTMRLGSYHRYEGVRFFVFLILVLWLSTSSSALAGVAEEYRVKAAFFYHFARFIEWPAETFNSGDDPFRVCIVGQNPFQGQLEKMLADKSVHNHSFRIISDPSDSDLGTCHVVFIGKSSSGRSGVIANLLQNQAVLTIGESADFIQQGGMIRLFLDKSKVRFGINPKAAERAHLEISSKLLRLANIERP